MSDGGCNLGEERVLDDEEVRLEVGSLLRRKRRCVVGFVSEGDIELVVVDGRLGDGG